MCVHLYWGCIHPDRCRCRSLVCPDSHVHRCQCPGHTHQYLQCRSGNIAVYDNIIQVTTYCCSWIHWHPECSQGNRNKRRNQLCSYSCVHSHENHQNTHGFLELKHVMIFFLQWHVMHKYLHKSFHLHSACSQRYTGRYRSQECWHTPADSH